MKFEYSSMAKSMTAVLDICMEGKILRSRLIFIRNVLLLESHIVTTLTSSTLQVIMNGDLSSSATLPQTNSTDMPSHL